MVEIKKDDIYPLIHLFVRLVLILLIAKITIELAISSMKIINNLLHNCIEDA